MALAGLTIAVPSVKLRKSYMPMAELSMDSNEGKTSISVQFPSKRTVLGCGTVVIDYLASVATYPQPDEKIRSVDFEFQGGGNVGNSLTGAARLGLQPILISKVADDALGIKILEELEKDGVDTSNVVVAKGGISPFTYVIIDKEKLTRTCIHTPGYPPMRPTELNFDKLSNILHETDLVFFDCRLTDTAIEIAKKASEMNIPILIDTERKREFLDDLLPYVDYIVCSSKFPQAWTGAGTVAEGLLYMALKLSKLKFVVVTLGEAGCIMLEKTTDSQLINETIEVNEAVESLQQQLSVDKSSKPIVASSKVARFVLGDNHVFGRLLVGSSQYIPSSKLVDTTGAGDAFVAAVMYSLCAELPPERMLPFAATVAAANCQAVGARAGLPTREDSKILHML